MSSYLNFVDIRHSTLSQETKAGAAINRLKKNKSPEIQKLAVEIIGKWKAAVDAEKKRKRPADDGNSEQGGGEKRTKTADGSQGDGTNKDLSTSKSNGQYISNSEPWNLSSKSTCLVSTVNDSKKPPVPERPGKTQRKYSTIDETGQKDRSAEKDKPEGLEPVESDSMPDKEKAIRDKGVTMCYDALAFDNISGTFEMLFRNGLTTLMMSYTFAEASLIVSRATAMEFSIYEKVGRTTGNDYRASE